MNEAFICDAVRTPIGRYGGALSSIRTDDLASIPIRSLLERNPGMNPTSIEDVILGCANQAGEDNRNVARMALLLSGIPETVPGQPSIGFAVQEWMPCPVPREPSNPENNLF